MQWQTSRFLIDLARPKVMGIVNVTPDSFSDGGQLLSLPAALRHCEQLLKDGADILDIGGESSRPGAQAVSLAEEQQRVLPLIKQAVKFAVPISLDSYKPQVMQAALDLGADIINDIWALRWDGAGPKGDELVSKHPTCGVCLMHMHLQPQSMQAHPMQGDVLPQVRDFLQQRADALCAIGVARQRLVLDPGIGFGKTVAQNFSLLARQAELLRAGYPLLLGWSRKSSLATMTHPLEAPLDAHQRLAPSLAAALLAVERGANIVRVHDVRETVQVLKVLQAAS